VRSPINASRIFNTQTKKGALFELFVLQDSLELITKIYINRGLKEKSENKRSLIKMGKQYPRELTNC
jgi:hypothetical protein